MSKLVEAHIEEINAIKKDLAQVDLKIAFCYPNNYRAGMASLGLQLIYRLWNSYDRVACERTFLPLKKTVEPYTLESDRPLREMDVIAFTLQYEDDYTNVLDILERSNIPLESSERNNNHPLVIAGGPCAQSNPVPMSSFIDAFMIGDLEPINEEFMTEGLLGNNTRLKRMEVLNEFEWMWVPEIEEDKSVKHAPKGNIDDYFYPIKQIIPQVEQEDPWYGVFGKSFMLEVVRGCNRGCSFCLTGRINRPKRDRSLEKLTEIYRAGTRECNVEKITPIGSGISDYRELENLCQNILDDNLTFSLPSIRADKITDNLVKLLVKAKQRTITTAPEAGTDKLRKQICKGVSDEEIIQAIRTASDGGLSRVKAYFILGLPDETVDDVEAIATLAEEMSKVGKKLRKIRISCGFFIPKPWTGYQDKSLFSLKDLQAKSKLLKSKTRNIAKVDCEITNPKMARIQTILSISGKEISKPLKLAAKLGGGLGDWRRALSEYGMSIEGIVENRVIDEKFPWEFIKLK
ncbi:MAG: radical SAM protein [Candidatus Heimdallarchaeota archaeon]|nr:MAG: radical SAM protein [Candidatus Heimdallarchaeota archaeon]